MPQGAGKTYAARTISKQAESVRRRYFLRRLVPLRDTQVAFACVFYWKIFSSPRRTKRAQNRPNRSKIKAVGRIWTLPKHISPMQTIQCQASLICDIMVLQPMRRMIINERRVQAHWLAGYRKYFNFQPTTSIFGRFQSLRARWIRIGA